MSILSKIERALGIGAKRKKSHKKHVRRHKKATHHKRTKR